MQRRCFETEDAVVAHTRTGCVLPAKMVGERCRGSCLIERLVEDACRADRGRASEAHVSPARSPEPAEFKTGPLDRSSQALEFPHAST